jgi:hypothetical protein
VEGSKERVVSVATPTQEMSSVPSPVVEPKVVKMSSLVERHEPSTGPKGPGRVPSREEFEGDEKKVA